MASWSSSACSSSWTSPVTCALTAQHAGTGPPRRSAMSSIENVRSASPSFLTARVTTPGVDNSVCSRATCASVTAFTYLPVLVIDDLSVFVPQRPSEQQAPTDPGQHVPDALHVPAHIPNVDTRDEPSPLVVARAVPSPTSQRTWPFVANQHRWFVGTVAHLRAEDHRVAYAERVYPQGPREGRCPARRAGLPRIDEPVRTYVGASRKRARGDSRTGWCGHLARDGTTSRHRQ